MTSDDRLTWGLIGEVLDALERHGYHRYDNRHTAHAIGAIAGLDSLYEGTRDASYDTYLYQPPSAQHADPVPAGPHDAVVLTDAEVSTIFTALEIAAGHKRDRAEMCADCPDQSCLTCQSRLRDAHTYDQMAAQLLQTAEASRTASSCQADPGFPPDPLQPHPAADKEAGQ
jgi:hypothetical protein